MRYSEEEDGSVYTVAAQAMMLAAIERYFMVNRKGLVDRLQGLNWIWVD